MRKAFAHALLQEARYNKDIVLLTGDLGFGMWDEFQKELPGQFFNVGASEQAMADIAVGLAYAGDIPVCYSITTFLLYRAFETWRTYANHENLNIKLVGSGRNNDYLHDGISHDSTDASIILDTLPNIVQFWPQKEEEIEGMVKRLLTNGKPSFISLKR
jgi:transketolase